MSMKNSWKRLLETLDEYRLKGNLRPGASKKEIKRLENNWDLLSPDELSQLLSITNGEDRSCNGDVLFGLRLLSTDEILDRHRKLYSMIEEGVISVNEVGDDQYEKYHLRKSGQTWRPGWVTFAEQKGHLYLISDHVPPDDGKKGQVFFRTFCQSVREVRANSITEFFDKYESLAAASNCHPCPLDVSYLSQDEVD